MEIRAWPAAVAAIALSLASCTSGDLPPDTPSGTAPPAPVVRIAPDSPVQGLALVAEIALPYTIPEGTSVDYTFAWYSDGQQRSELTADEVPVATTLAGERWTVMVRPWAGEVEGPAATDTVTILDPDQDSDGDGFSPSEGDCDDGDDQIGPDFAEVCDGLDSDCDGVTPGWELDEDGDGYTICDDGSGSTDCDDDDSTRYPGAPELCNGIDDDCDGNVPDDELDQDHDGYAVCDDGSGPADCDDADATRYPGAPEQCDGEDDDCDGVVPDDEADLDGDGYMVCDDGSGAVDCDDLEPDSWPDGPEVDDGVDNDCDGLVDEIACSPELVDVFYTEVAGNGDPWIDPGEQWRMELLAQVPCASVALSAEVVPQSPEITAVQPAADFGVVDAATPTWASTPAEVSIDASATSLLSYSLQLDLDAGGLIETVDLVVSLGSRAGDTTWDAPILPATPGLSYTLEHGMYIDVGGIYHYLANDYGDISACCAGFAEPMNAGLEADAVYGMVLSAGQTVSVHLYYWYTWHEYPDPYLYVSDDPSQPDLACLAGVDDRTDNEEHLLFTAPADGLYYLVVDVWDQYAMFDLTLGF